MHCCFRLFLPVFLAALIVSCQSRKSSASFSPEEIGRYIAAYVPGSIDAGETVRVRFAVPVDTSRSADALSFQPSVKGSVRWEDELTLAFTPDDGWRPGIRYEMTVRLDHLIPDVDPAMKRVAFSFEVRPVRLWVQTEPLSPEFDGDKASYLLRGQVHVSRPVDSATVRRLLQISNTGKAGPVQWYHDPEGRAHDFTIGDIQPDAVISLRWDGKPIGAVEKGDRMITAPKANELSLLSFEPGADGERKVSVFFSQQLDPRQELAGLVLINGLTTGFTLRRQGHILHIYPSDDVTGSMDIQVDRQLASSLGHTLSAPLNLEISLDDTHPGLRVVGSGVITPGQEEIVVPFEAINLRGVVVEVVRIFENNILQYLQTSDLEDPWNLEPVGRIILQRKVDLAQLADRDNRLTWTRYGLDLGPLVKLAPGSIYQVRIGFDPDDTYLDCYADIEVDHGQAPFGELSTRWTYKYNYDGFTWNHQDDPCYPAFYNPERFISRNLLASDIGLMAKQNGTGDLWIYATAITTAQPASGLEVEAFDFQQQSLGKAVTGADGSVRMSVARKAFFVVASRGDQRGYLKLADGLSLSLSEFDAGGTSYQDGLRGYMYGERDIWRPGDSVHLHFVLWDPEEKIDNRHPVQLTVTNPLGQIQIRRTSPLAIGGIYDLSFATAATDPTGSWMARVKVGDAVFSRSLKIETVKPNRLRIDMQLPESVTAGETSPLQLTSSWLFGAPAADLKAIVEAQFAPRPFTARGFAGFAFSDPARFTPPSVLTIFEGNLNAEGKAMVPVPAVSDYLPEGQLTMAVKTRVFERGGDFSTDRHTTIFHPYTHYAGVAVPVNRWGYAEMKTQEANAVRLASVTPAGQGAARRRLSIGLYHAQWRWWWDQTRGDITQYNSKLHLGAFTTDTVMTGADGTVDYSVKPVASGSYMIRVCDLESGHCAGTFYYAGAWGDPTTTSDAASQLTFSAEKEQYAVGEKVTVQVPSAKGAMLLLTLEKNNQILLSRWYPAEGDQTKITFDATPEMMPNVYAFITHVQPYAHPSNDMPLRMYGVIPVRVDDPATKLEPVITMANELKPDADFTVTVSEKHQAPMAYTLAVVDEGLLNLTRFATPDPRSYFSRQEALAVQTWDMYDQVLGGYGGTLDRLLSIGGDDALVLTDAPQAERFKPVVMHLGPYYLEAGQKRAHTLHMPAYVGAVRVMVVASHNTRWGSAAKTCPVKADLMIQPTLPRVVSPGETIRVPVSVFAMADQIRSVDVSIQSNDMATVSGPARQSIAFASGGEKMAYFTLTIPRRSGLLKVSVTASGAGKSARQEVELDVRLPNPPQTEVVAATLKPGESWTGAIPKPGISGTNTAALELSQMPAIDLERRLKFLIQYPYGCLEQTISAVFPQLYLHQLAALNQEQLHLVRSHIQAGIQRLKSYSLPAGGFTYWPGESSRDPWANSYAGHFLIEAGRQGYVVDKTMLDNWREAQRKDAQVYRPGRYYRDDLNQAYRLYTLAIDGQPMWGMMNRLRTQQQLDVAAAWMLAAAYAAGNRKDVAEAIIQALSRDVKAYTEMANTYGSDLRDKAIMLQTFLSLGKDQEAQQIARQVAAHLSSETWYGTHSVAYALMAMGKMAGQFSGAGIKAQLITAGKGAEALTAAKGMILRNLTGPADQVTIQNTGPDPLFVRLTGTGRPMEGSKTEQRNNLSMVVRYLDMKGQPVNPDRLVQGRDFVVQIQVTNPGTFAGQLDQLALTYLFPSGWELANQRLETFADRFRNSGVRYLDIRDDRLNAFFSMDRGVWTYHLLMTATYAGRFWLPDVSCGAMYVDQVSARTPGRWVEVVPAADSSADLQ